MLVESLEKHGPNVISFELVTGERRLLMVRGYASPSGDDATNQFISRALDGQVQGQDCILLGDLNSNLIHPRDDREAMLVAELAGHGLEDMISHFWQRSRYGHLQTWNQSFADRRIQSSRCDYILSSDRQLLVEYQKSAPPKRDKPGSICHQTGSRFFPFPVYQTRINFVLGCHAKFSNTMLYTF